MSAGAQVRLNTRSGRWTRQIGWTAGGVAIIGLLVFPIYWMIVLAFESSQSILANTPILWPHHFTTDNIARAWHLVAGDIWTSVIISLSAVVLVLLLAVPAAYALAQVKFRWAVVLMLALLLAQMIPGISLSLSYYTIFAKLHLLNSYLGLILANTTYGVPFAVVLLRAFFTTVPRETLDAARIDGCGEWRTFGRIALPLAAPGIITASLFAFLFSWGDFLFSVTLNAAGQVRPVTLGLYQFVGVYSSDWGGIMAALALALIPATLFLVFAQRWLTVGVRSGGLTG